MSEAWKEMVPHRWQRVDGAVVRYDQNSPHMRPWLAGSRGWLAFGPGFDEVNYDYIKQRSKRGIGWPVRYKTPQAAMRAVDKHWPLP